MTGGTEKAGKINRNLARACSEHGLGMGLGSCRALLFADDYFEDFNMRPILGNDTPFYANLGIAQVEKLMKANEINLIDKLIQKLHADGLIIHVNPLQEWLQPEGDRFEQEPIRIISDFLQYASYPVIVKEVGQGFGPESIRQLMQLPLAAIDFAALGGTNFSKLELLRQNDARYEVYSAFARIGHTAEEMVTFVNKVAKELADKVICKQFIISGGVGNFLDGYYLTQKCNFKAVYGQASKLLERALESYDSLSEYIAGQIEGFRMAKAMLRVAD